MDVYKAKSVYKAPGVYRSGIYKDPSEVVLLNCVRYENRFYEIDSDNVGSTFVDAVRLPEGYEKLGRVWYNGTYDDSYPSLIETDFELPLQFGDIYCGFNIVYAPLQFVRIFATQRIASTSYKATHYFSSGNSTSVSRCSIWNTRNEDGQFSKSVQFSDANKIKENLLSGTWRTLSPQTGPEPVTRKIWLLTSRGRVDLRFFFVADRNKQVTFTAIPCKHDSDYGLYDVVAGKFYTHANLTGELPRQGDVLYVPSACAYTPNPDGSVPEGTPTGKAKIVPLEKVDDAAMIAAGYESVGVVAAVFGRKVYIVWKNVDTQCKWCTDAKSISYKIPSTIDVDALIQETMEDNADRKGFRQGISWEVLRAKLSGEGLPSGQNTWNGGTSSDGEGSYFYTLQEWTTVDQGSKHPSADELETYGTGVDGWERYLRSRFIKYPSSFNAPIYKDGQAETKILTDINASEGRAFFPIANFAATHYTTYGSFGTDKNFWNVPGLRFGDWFMAGAKVQRELFKDVSCSNSSVLKSTDRVNIAMSKISSTRISLYEKWYWLPVLRSRNIALGMGLSGSLNGNGALYNDSRVLSCALLNY